MTDIKKRLILILDCEKKKSGAIRVERRLWELNLMSGIWKINLDISEMWVNFEVLIYFCTAAKFTRVS